MMTSAGWLVLLSLGQAQLVPGHVSDPNGAPAAGDPPATATDARARSRMLSPPLGLPPLEPGRDGLPSAAQIGLGRKLFLDRRLSANGTLSCAMCHVPEQGFAVNELQTAVGFQGKRLRRNAPTLLNVAHAGPLFHDGREPVLELQPLDVLVSPDEMALPSLGALVAKVQALPDYPHAFESAYGGPVTVERIGRALAAYLRTLLAAGSPFDRWRYGGEGNAMSEPARRGFELFVGKAGCASCHTVGKEHALFTDHAFHDTGIGWLRSLGSGDAPIRIELSPGVATSLPASVVGSVGEPPPNDLGRYEVTGDPTDRWRFKTPSLRNVALTAPYMHDGSLGSLALVVRLYNAGSHPHEGLDPRLRPLALSEAEMSDLVALLESLTGAGLDELVRDARSQGVGNPAPASR